MRVLVWDWPVRIFHWLLVLAFAGAWLSHGDDRYTDAHAFFGYVALVLALFRLGWGVVGTRHARFRAFAASPAQAIAYLRDLFAHRATRYVGHNPVGSWAVWLLLALTIALGISGVLTLGGEEQQGPLAGWLDRATGIAVGEWHELIAWAGVALIAVHVVGVIAEGRVHRENLVRAMLDGHKDAGPADAIGSARPWIAVGLCASLAGFAGWYFHGYFTATPAHPYLPYTSPPLPASAQWTEECGSCHLAYHPSLLPARSWQAMLAQQGDHFGEDLVLDDTVIASLQAFALAHAAEQGESEAAVKIAASVAESTEAPSSAIDAARTAATATPLRITDTVYWQRQHAGIDDAVWKTAPVHGKGDCGACHYDAEAATFEDSAMRIPR